MLGSHRYPLKTKLVIFWVYVSVVFIARNLFDIIDFILTFNHYNLWVQTWFKRNSFDPVYNFLWNILWDVRFFYTVKVIL